MRHHPFSDEIKISVLGAGVAGIGSALSLADSGRQVDIYERNEEPLKGTSDVTPARGGHGFHYMYPKTAILYLKATLEVVKTFPDCLIGYGKPDSHYLRHGLYFIMKSPEELGPQDQQFASLFPADNIISTYEKIKAAYQELVDSDPTNKVFGEPENFFIKRNLQDYKEIVDISKVAAAIDTREELINWNVLKQKLRGLVYSHPKIRLHTSTTIFDIKKDEQSSKFLINSNKGLFKSDIIVNSTWENIEYLNNTAGVPFSKDSRTNRLKALVRVKLPNILIEKSSMFFCMGPHCMFSNMGNGTGLITYAPKTNMTNSTELKISDEMETFLQGRATYRTKRDIARSILEGVSQYIPPMKKAKILNVRFGIIKTFGTVDLLDPASQVHIRDQLGVEMCLPGLISNPGMKLLYFLSNGKEVLDIVNRYLSVDQEELLKQKKRHNSICNSTLPKQAEKELSVNLKNSISCVKISSGCFNFLGMEKRTIPFRKKRFFSEESKKIGDKKISASSARF